VDRGFVFVNFGETGIGIEEIVIGQIVIDL
jgi:hypothetical protein